MLRRLAALTTTRSIYTQILVGATMRHTDAGTGDPRLPADVRPPRPAGMEREDRHPFRASRRRADRDARGRSRPPGTCSITIAARRELMRPAMLLLLFLSMQITLGAFVVWSGMDPVINTAHVVNGALVLATSLVLTLRTLRRSRGTPARRSAGSAVRVSTVIPGFSRSRRRRGREVDAAVARRRPHARSRDFVALAKPRLNLLVVASTLAGYRWPTATSLGVAARRRAAARHRPGRRRRVGVQPGDRARPRRADAAHAHAAACRISGCSRSKGCSSARAITLAGTAA